MNKKIALITGLIFSSLTLTNVASATTFGVFPQGTANAVNVYLNDELLKLDVPAKVISDRTMLPLRGIFESLGATVEWVQSTNSIEVTKDSTTIELSINSKTAKVNGQETTLDVPPTVVNNRTLVPVRFISETLGANVTWDAGTQSAFVSLRPLPSTKVLVDYLQSLQPYAEAIDQAAIASTTIYTSYYSKKITYAQFKSQYDAQVKIMQDSVASMKAVTVPDDTFAKLAAEKFIGVAEEQYASHLNRENAIYSDHVDTTAMKNAYNQNTIVNRDITALNVEYSK
jgi:hypothetical protein